MTGQWSAREKDGRDLELHRTDSPSWPTPSCKQPSPVKHQILLLTMSNSGLLYCVASCFAAIARPTEFAIPCPCSCVGRVSVLLLVRRDVSETHDLREGPS